VPDPDPTDNTDGVTTEVLPGRPTVEVDKRLVSVDLDDQYPNYVVFSIEVTNVGPTAIDMLPLFDDYDPYFLRFVDASPSPTIVDDGTGLVTWHDLTGSPPHGFGINLEPGDSILVIVRFVVEHNITTYSTNWARVTDAIDINDNTADPAEDSVRVIGVPTSVELLHFHASAAGDAALVDWETASESDLWGFKIYRSLTPVFDDAEMIHSELSQGGNLVGHEYQYYDADVVTGQVYYYWLTYHLNSDPDNTLYVWAGPVRVGVGQHRVYLPMITH
jgi:hypothetical protein